MTEVKKNRGLDGGDHSNPMEDSLESESSKISISNTNKKSFPFDCVFCGSSNTKQGVKSDIGVCLNCGAWFSAIENQPKKTTQITAIVKLSERYNTLQCQISMLYKIAKKLGVDVHEK